ncbi:MAG: oligoendopeptidase F [Planctomycetes bacterium]|nr:oligoendopeptidase F [Planctomycetota bacterium]
MKTCERYFGVLSLRSRFGLLFGFCLIGGQNTRQARFGEAIFMRWNLVLFLVLVIALQLPALAVERKDIKLADKWNLEEIFESDEAWNEAKDALAGKVDGILVFKGKISKSAAELLACLKFGTAFSKDISRLYAYAGMRSDEDTRISKYNGMIQQLQYISTEYGTNSSFIEPEICSMDSKTIAAFISQKHGLKVYKKYLGDIQRTKAHKLSDKEEALLAQTGLIASTSSSIYKVFSNAELPFPTVELTDGRKVTLNQSAYGLHRLDKNRENREIVFKAFWQLFDSFKQTFGAQLSGSVKKNIFYSRARKYDTALEMHLDRNNIPTDVYHTLIKNAHDNLDVLHRFLKIKKRLLGVETLKYSDLYVSGVSGGSEDYPYEKGIKLVVESLAPLGADYVAAVERSFRERWIDVYPSPGKRSGAYCNGSAFDVHPYMLLNYNGKYGDVSTLTHEMGHAMHSYFSNKSQPYPIAGYSIFAAEVASTFNEILLVNKSLKESKNDDEKLYLLVNYLDRIRSTVFRQTQFAEFELKMFEKAENNEPLTGDVLTEIYGDILKEYYGHDKGVCHIDDLYTVEWAYVPHFYSSFYVYQYATSFSASVALAERVMSKEPGAVDKFIAFLSSGGSDYPVELLKKAGVDLTTSKPFQQMMDSMRRAMDEVEKILDKKGK